MKRCGRAWEKLGVGGGYIVNLAPSLCAWTRVEACRWVWKVRKGVDGGWA